MVLAIDVEAMAGLPGVVVMDRSDLTSPEVCRNVEGFMAGRKADVIMRLGCHCKRFFVYKAIIL